VYTALPHLSAVVGPQPFRHYRLNAQEIKTYKNDQPQPRHPFKACLGSKTEAYIPSFGYTVEIHLNLHFRLRSQSASQSKGPEPLYSLRPAGVLHSRPLCI